MEARLINLFYKYLEGWSWEEWQAAGSSDREEVAVNAIADLGPEVDVEEAYDIFYDWAAGLTEADFGDLITEDTDDDPYGYGPYKTFSDPDLAVGDYVLTMRPFNKSGRTYPARITSISPKWIDYEISGFGFTDRGTKARPGSTADKTLKNARTYLKNLGEARDETLAEAPNFWSSQDFWKEAKRNVIDDRSFHAAYDAELKELGLMDLFDDNGILTSQGVYGRIKKAKDANPDSWAVKALLKMWVLQFKENVKPNSQMRRERDEAERAKRAAARAAQDEQKRIEQEAKYEAAMKEWKILDENFHAIQDTINNTIKEYVDSKKAVLKPDLEKAVNLKTEIVAATKGIIKFYNQTEELNLSRLNKENELIKTEVNLEEPSKRFPIARIWIKVREFFGQYPNFRSSDKSARDYTSITVKAFEEDTIKSTVVAMLDDIWEVVSHRLNTLASIQKQYDTVMTKVNTAKAAQSAANTGKPVDTAFISEILAEFDKGRKAAQKAYNFYSDTQDGSAGAAKAMATQEALVAVGTYLVNCNWRALADGREVAIWRMTDSTDELFDALEDTFNAFSSDLIIEIIK